MERSPIPIYIFFTRTIGPLEILRRRLIAESWIQEPSRLRRLGKLGFVLLWPVISAIRSIATTYRNRQTLSKLFKKPYWKVSLEQWLAALWYALPPSEFVKNAHVIAANPRITRLIMSNQERAYLVNAIENGLVKHDLNDKIRFFERCRDAQLPCVPVLYAFRDGRVHPFNHTSFADITKMSGLFAKLSADQKGIGAMAWSNVGDEQFRHFNGELYSYEQILDELRNRSESGTSYIIQPRVENHESIRDLSSGALATVRLWTGRALSGEIYPLLACFRMPMGNSLTDNFSGGGLAAGIDMSTGSLGPAYVKSASRDPVSRHPGTGGIIEGRKLPNFSEVVQVGLRAHQEFSEFLMIGWDIALSPAGPVLLEGNQNPSVDIQFVTGTPLGETHLAELAVDWLELRSANRNART